MLLVFNRRKALVVGLGILVFFGYLVILHFIAVVGSLFIVIQNGVMGWNVRLRIELTSCFVKVSATDASTSSLEFSIEFTSILKVSLFPSCDDVQHGVGHMALSVSLFGQSLELASVLRLRVRCHTGFGVDSDFFSAGLSLHRDGWSHCLYTSR